MLNFRRANSIFLLISLAIIFSDQYTKAWASTFLQDGVVQDVFSFLEFHLAHNYGAAFSFLSNAGGWQRWFFLVFSFVVSVVILIWILNLKSDEKFLGIALSLILGGAVGNLIDRANLGYVVDFISVFYSGYVFPTFNIADAGISLGAFLIILDMIFFEAKREQKRSA